MAPTDASDSEGAGDQSTGPEEQSEGMQVALADLPKGDATKVGDKVPMEVTAVDTENGTATVQCCASASMSGGGIKKMAAAFDDNQEG